MVAISSLVLAAIIATGAIAAPSGKDGNLLGLEKRQNTPPSQGTHSGYFYSWWTDLQSPATYENLPGGSYRVRWQSGGNLIGGKGWNTGPANRTIRFNGTFEADGDSYLAVYGWTTNPLVEYYIIENWTAFDPSHGGPASSGAGAPYRRMGSVICDGVSYAVGVTRRYPLGGNPVIVLWSVRSTGRTSGIVNTSCHLNAWTNTYGLAMGTHVWQVVATEGYFSSGSAEITVAQVN